jgi:hypothetical protein
MLNPKRLLDDARILVAHASTEGLEIHPSANDEIRGAHWKIRTGRFGIEDEQRLNALISELAQLAHPHKLQDLRASYEKPAKFLSYLRLSTVLPIVSIVLVLQIIGLTTNFSEITSRIAELKTLEQEHYWDKLEHASRLYASVVANKDSQEKAYTDLGTEVSKLRDVAGGLGLAAAEIRPVIDGTSGGPNWCYLTFHLYGFSSWCGPSLGIPAPVSPMLPSAEIVQPAGQAVAPPLTPETSAPTPQTPGSATGGASTQANAVEVVSSDSLNQLGRGLRDGIQFALAFGLNITSPDQMQGTYLSRRQAESVAVFLGSSILPLLYGLLGASVFLMRQLFGESHGTVVTVTTAKAVLRLGLGGIAGLAIGWFWVPDASKSVSEVAKLSTAPFALAFLAGFSIELLFSLLDRILAALNPSNVPPPAPQSGGG